MIFFFSLLVIFNIVNIYVLKQLFYKNYILLFITLYIKNSILIFFNIVTFFYKKKWYLNDIILYYIF